MASFSTALILAKRLDISSVAFADYEMNDFLRDMGFPQQRLFSRTKQNSSEKLGYVCDDDVGPYMWRLESSKDARKVNTEMFDPSVLTSLGVQTKKVIERA